MKFLVLWHFDISRLTPEVVKAITQQPQYGERLEKEGKLEYRCHVVGSHGGAWIYKVDSNEDPTDSSRCLRFSTSRLTGS